ncbi:MAG: V-type ATP synthase subunit D [Armatimonadota bacterium]|nr:V-type ATP synthase subunit D [Armatimonadota bacterium]MDR5703974.1 V-type ATP synthase subunit D [Armatimonadota bacterium]MDR7434413.1 V-type ATP synthase subunit D [Armatimonadota bacterium]
MQTISPTRMNLLQRRNQLRLAEQGVDLLKKKRDALVQDFFNVVRRALEARERLNRKCEEAYVLLSLTKAWEGREALESAALARKQELFVDIDIRNVWGTKIPEVSPVNGRATPSDRYNPVDVSAGTLETRSNFEEVLAALLEVASTEVKLKKIGEEIKKTTRRVNALEQIVIPRIRSEIRYIRAVLEQREREDIYRLKRIKKKLEAKEKGQRSSSEIF